MRLPYRDHHLIQFLESWRQTSDDNNQEPQKEDLPRSPLDRSLYLYFRAHSALGSKDRDEIGQSVYQLVRWKLALDALHPKVTFPSWLQRLNWLRAGDLEKRKSLLAPPASVSFPAFLFQLLVDSYSQDKAIELAEILQEQAPVFLRANALKTTREELLGQLPASWLARKGHEEHSIVLGARAALFQSEWFKRGHFEMQDEGSQHLAGLVQAQPGDWVLDYCAGSGGKSLAIAPRLQGKGQLFLHDIRKRALIEAKARLKRAGIQNAQILTPDHEQLQRLKKKCRWVLVDAPCSGSGTLRRNPDMKERINDKLVRELVSSQRCIFERALSFLDPQGFIVYATCSLLKQENEEQVEHFLKTYPIELQAPLCKILPQREGPDGFFAAVFRKKSGN